MYILKHFNKVNAKSTQMKYVLLKEKQVFDSNNKP